MNSAKRQLWCGTACAGSRSRFMIRTLLATGAPLALFLAACSPPDEPDTQAGAPVPPQETIETAPTDGATSPQGEQPAGDTSGTIGGDGSEISLEPVTGTDIPAIPGELGCAFTSADGQTLLVAKANVGDDATPNAAVNNGGYGEALASTQTGGFGALETDGAKFAGRGLTITLTTDGPAGNSATEVTTRPAEMLVQRGDGAERTYQGDWSCGP